MKIPSHDLATDKKIVMLALNTEDVGLSLSYKPA
jgi:hypothetical protein